ncbi:hypothetical protein ACFVUS_42865 [Nocardia sp. NPDC058058]|uniref:hypothetical protein n=1 Tax=Nocardia sp. NPDC058058 TaxID=3346317 RepID=UPI0036DA9C04
MKRMIVNTVAAVALSSGLLLAGTSAALAAPSGLPLEPAQVADGPLSPFFGSGSASGSALLLKCLTNGSSVAHGGDPMGFPAICV